MDSQSPCSYIPVPQKALSYPTLGIPNGYSSNPRWHFGNMQGHLQLSITMTEGGGGVIRYLLGRG